MDFRKQYLMSVYMLEEKAEKKIMDKNLYIFFIKLSNEAIIFNYNIDNCLYFTFLNKKIIS